MPLFKVLPFPLDDIRCYVIGFVGNDGELLNFVRETWSDATGVELVTKEAFLKDILRLKDSNGHITWHHDKCKVLTQNGIELIYEVEQNPAFQLAGYLGIELPPAGSVPNSNMMDVD